MPGSEEQKGFSWWGEFGEKKCFRQIHLYRWVSFRFSIIQPKVRVFQKRWTSGMAVWLRQSWIMAIDNGNQYWWSNLLPYERNNNKWRKVRRLNSIFSWFEYDSGSDTRKLSCDGQRKNTSHWWDWRLFERTLCWFYLLATIFPDYNPIELVFGWIKGQLKYETCQNLRDTVIRVIQSVQTSVIESPF